ncbi:MAG: hypothetical protein AAGU11_11060, partial [Syntrophobacteraceae bacterium]
GPRSSRLQGDPKVHRQSGQCCISRVGATYRNPPLIGVEKAYLTALAMGASPVLRRADPEKPVVETARACRAHRKGP